MTMNWTLICLLIFVPLASSVGLYEQCGGEGYTGSTQCNWPLQCFRRSRWFSSCQTSCPGGDWECGSTGYTGGDRSPVGAQPWDQCGGEGWKGSNWCLEYPCVARSQWYSQCRPDCPTGWTCSANPTPVAPTVPSSTVAPIQESTTPDEVEEVASEEVAEEDLEELELYNPDDYADEEELETDEFPDPSESNLDELQRQEEELNGVSEVDEEEIVVEGEDEEESTHRRRRNTG
jgi:hypothetical protein